MKITHLKLRMKNEKSGYAILFTVVVISVIMAIAIGMSNTVFKELNLASVANDSQSAFYEADTATECGLYAEIVLGLHNGDDFHCGMDTTDTTFDFTADVSTSHFNLVQDTIPDNSPCFKVTVDKPTSDTSVMQAKGYSNCDLTSTRTVERAIEVFY